MLPSDTAQSWHLGTNLVLLLQTITPRRQSFIVIYCFASCSKYLSGFENGLENVQLTIIILVVILDIS